VVLAALRLWQRHDGTGRWKDSFGGKIHSPRSRINPFPASSPREKDAGRKGRFMTREELLTNQERMWQTLSGEQSMTLTLAVEMLLRCHLSPYQILTKTMMALEGLQHDC
jgi:hypothetical protein